jgi:L,D-peptidoglycan transpeptidase YkuD (ErfK/YbiS/YcfS/YnhG family)
MNWTATRRPSPQRGSRTLSAYWFKEFLPPRIRTSFIARFILSAIAFFMLSLSMHAQSNKDLGGPPASVPDQTRQAVVVRPGRGFQATLTAWERGTNGWRRIAGPWPAVGGRNGFAPPGKKREGDGRTPSGIFRLGLAFGRSAALPTGLVYRQATEDDYWVDDPASPFYNQWVKGKSKGISSEKMLLNNGLYDVGIVVEYNTAPSVPGHGSAIFVHLWGEHGKQPTSGCVALDRAQLTTLIRWLNAAANPVIVLGELPT